MSQIHARIALAQYELLSEWDKPLTGCSDFGTFFSAEVTAFACNVTASKCRRNSTVMQFHNRRDAHGKRNMCRVGGRTWTEINMACQAGSLVSASLPLVTNERIVPDDSRQVLVDFCWQREKTRPVSDHARTSHTHTDNTYRRTFPQCASSPQTLTL